MGTKCPERYRDHSMWWKGRIGRLLLAVVATVATVVLCSPAPAAAAPDDAAMEARLLELVNEDRAALGLPPVAVDADAATRAREVAVSHRDAGRMQHTPLDQLAAWYVPPHEGVAELLAHTGGTAEAVHAAWLRSDYHRGVLRNGAYDLGGIALALDADGSVWAVAHLLDSAPAREQTSPEPEAAPPPPPASVPAASPPPDGEAPTSGPADGPTTPAPAPSSAPAPPPSPPPTVTGEEDGVTFEAADLAPTSFAGGPVPSLPDPADASPTTGATAEDGGNIDGEPAGGFQPDVAAAVSAPTLAVAAAVRRRRR